MTATGSTTLAALSVLGYHSQGKSVSETRADLLAKGVLKGTVSKVCAVLRALQDGRLAPDQVTSLNRAYWEIKHAPQDFRAICTAVRRLSGEDLDRLEAFLKKERSRRQ